MSKKKKKKEVIDRGQPWEIAFDMEADVSAVRDLAHRFSD